jgi:hypothetical protein
MENKIINVSIFYRELKTIIQFTQFFYDQMLTSFPDTLY